MAKARSIELSEAQQQELERNRDHHPKSYMRVKAAAILKVWAGKAIRQVAAQGLLKPVHEETVRDWITRYLHEGLSALLVQQGRGRKPAFSPCSRQHRNRRSPSTSHPLPQSTALRSPAQELTALGGACGSSVDEGPLHPRSL